MKRTDDRWLPVLLLGAQAVVWPGAALVRGTTPTAAELLAAVLVGGLVTAALTARRTRPVPVLTLVVAACAVGTEPLPAGAVAVYGTVGVALALYEVAAVRDTITALLCVVTLAVWQLVHGISLQGLTGGQGVDGGYGLDGSQGLDLVLTALLYAAATGTGLSVRRRRAARQAAARRLHRAEAERHRLPEAERRRMERELHDVSAHHLTAVVVTVEAALGLRDRRPELAGQALAFAAETGREVTRALSAVRAPSPSARDAPAPEERMRELVAGFRALGQPVTCDIEALPDGPAGDVVYAVVREALTNVVRHASGAPATVRCTYEDARTEVVVRNAPPDATGASHGKGLGGGRGQNFLRGRVREAGGTLTSGPTPDGGWAVRAVLPERDGALPAPAVPRAYRLAQCVAAVGLCFQPLLPFLVIRESTTPTGPGVSAGALFALLAAAQALTLLRLRQAPRTALGVQLVLAGLWPAAMAVGEYTGPAVLPPALNMLVTCATLALLAAGAAEADRTNQLRFSGRTQGFVLPAAAAAVHAAVVVVAVLTRRDAEPAWTVAGAAIAVAGLAAATAWALGTRYGRQRRAALDAHEERLAAWTEEAVRDAWAERRRITTGLETTVLARTAEVIAEAEAGRLAETAERARDALAAMRALLETVRAGEQHAEFRPQPTLQALDLLVDQCRATGRKVAVRLTDRVPERLPAAVDLAAYRAAETVLEAGAGDAHGPTTLVLDAADGALTLTATGVSGATRLAARQRLRTRATALGGTLSTGQPGAVVLRLPLTTVPDQEESR